MDAKDESAFAKKLIELVGITNRYIFGWKMLKENGFDDAEAFRDR
jgi:hypothetical protein